MTTPASVMKTAVLPPLKASRFAMPEPVTMNRLSLTFSIFVAATAAAESPACGA